jgi:FixJ family two-component response regulator
MAGFTGTGLTRLLDKHRPDLPIVLVSGHGICAVRLLARLQYTRDRYSDIAADERLP